MACQWKIQDTIKYSEYKDIVYFYLYCMMYIGLNDCKLYKSSPSLFFFFVCFVCNKRLILGYYTYRLGFADRASTISKQKIMFFSKIVIRLRRKWKKKKKTYNIKQSWSILVFLYPDRFLERWIMNERRIQIEDHIRKKYNTDHLLEGQKDTAQHEG